MGKYQGTVKKEFQGGSEADPSEAFKEVKRFQVSAISACRIASFAAFTAFPACTAFPAYTAFAARICCTVRRFYLISPPGGVQLVYCPEPDNGKRENNV